MIRRLSISSYAYWPIDILFHEEYGSFYSTEFCLFLIGLIKLVEKYSLFFSEVSQKEKNKYRILTRICGTWENGTDEPVCRAEIETQM